MFESLWKSGASAPPNWPEMVQALAPATHRCHFFDKLFNSAAG